LYNSLVRSSRYPLIIVLEIDDDDDDVDDDGWMNAPLDEVMVNANARNEDE